MKNDYTTSTVDGAAGWARVRAEREDSDVPSKADLAWDEYYAKHKDDEEEYEDEDEICSDTGCTCGGQKIGRIFFLDSFFWNAFSFEFLGKKYTLKN